MPKRTEEEKKEIRKKWKELVNMSPGELKSWDENKDKLKASLNREEASRAGIRSGLQSLKNIIRKKNKPFDKWTDKDYDDASAEINFNSRMLGSKPGKEVPGTGKSKWEIFPKELGPQSEQRNQPGE